MTPDNDGCFITLSKVNVLPPLSRISIFGVSGCPLLIVKGAAGKSYLLANVSVQISLIG